jgi:hypothetical protein
MGTDECIRKHTILLMTIAIRIAIQGQLQHRIQILINRKALHQVHINTQYFVNLSNTSMMSALGQYTYGVQRVEKAAGTSLTWRKQSGSTTQANSKATSVENHGCKSTIGMRTRGFQDY